MIRLDSSRYGNISQAAAVQRATTPRAWACVRQSVTRRSDRVPASRDGSRSPVIT
jgi:hypothetical protein